jgi:hypothetical protein
MRRILGVVIIYGAVDTQRAPSSRWIPDTRGATCGRCLPLVTEEGTEYYAEVKIREGRASGQ